MQSGAAFVGAPVPRHQHENVHIDYHAMVRDRCHADGWVRQARRSSAPLSPATTDRFKQAAREQREAGYVVRVERYNELIRVA